MIGQIGTGFLLGFLGSAHCVGMCGGFTLLAGLTGSRVRRPYSGIAAYISGKTVTYAIAGSVLAGAVNLAPTSAGVIQKVVAVLTGIFLVLVGWHMTGSGPNWVLVAPASASRLVASMSRAVRRSSIGGRFLLGLLNGLIPCGLVYAALGMSMTLSSAAGGALFMASFGLGTAPALVAVGLGSTVISSSRRAWMYRALGIVVMILGVLTVVRATPLMHRLMELF